MHLPHHCWTSNRSCPRGAPWAGSCNRCCRLAYGSWDGSTSATNLSSANSMPRDPASPSRTTGPSSSSPRPEEPRWG
ncbi:hypothetical protein ACFFX0_24355 [Citricoccus parietis]|uniref:Uncharacterized protein n=1 Tax=Citricoccus parietis TaxID=592307 RepID=A0ABV5G5E1_9MICC